MVNRGARSDTFVASPVTVPTGWVINNLPSTLSLRPFRSNLLFVTLVVPKVEVGGNAEQPFSIVVTSQNDAQNQIVIPLRLISLTEGFSVQLPTIYR